MRYGKLKLYKVVECSDYFPDEGLCVIVFNLARPWKGWYRNSPLICHFNPDSANEEIAECVGVHLGFINNKRQEPTGI